MNTTSYSSKILVNLDFLYIIMLSISLLLLTTFSFEGSLAPTILYIFMIIIGTILIGLFSNHDEIFFKTKLFIFFFSLYLIYTVINYYILLGFSPNTVPFNYYDENTFYAYSNLGLLYISGEKNFFDLFTFAAYPLHELPLHAMFTGIIAYFSIMIDGNNTIIAQKLLSPFFGGLLTVVLYSTLQYQFKDRIFALNATFAYALLSAVFIYSTPMLRDIDIALAYMIAIYLFLQKNNIVNFLILLLIAFLTYYLRPESGIVLFGFAALYSYLYVKKLQSIPIKSIFYILIVVLFSFLLLLMYNKIIGMILDKNEANLTRSIAQASTSSIGLLLNKLPFPLGNVAKVLFGQIQPFPFFLAIGRPPEAIAGILWPFIFLMMIYSMIKKNIRILIDIKLKYLLLVSIAVIFIMSSEPQVRRMMSVYPILYMVGLYVFLSVPKNEIKRAFVYYIFAIISLNVFYYLIKL